MFVSCKTFMFCCATTSPSSSNRTHRCPEARSNRCPPATICSSLEDGEDVVFLFDGMNCDVVVYYVGDNRRDD